MTTELLAIAALRAKGYEARYQEARDSLLAFCEVTFSGYLPAPHLALVAGELEAIERGARRRLIIMMPPRHGKTELVSVRFPAWCLGRNPRRKIISASYGETLASELGRRVRNLVQWQPVFPGVRLAEDSKARNLWHTSEGGQYLAVGAGSGVVGWGADIIVVDDPYGHGSEAYSETERTRIWNWYTSEILTRQEPGAAIVVVMHRWHEDDLVGRLVDGEHGEWGVVRLPALAEGDDPLSRPDGAALWPERYPAEHFRRLREQERLGERAWSSLYQQRPVPAEGAIFKHWPRYDPSTLPQLREVLFPIDAAAGGQDAVAWAAWGRLGQTLYLLGADQLTGDSAEAVRRASFSANEHKRRHPSAVAKWLYRKDVNIDRLLCQQLQAASGIQTALPVQLPQRTRREETADMVSRYFEGSQMLIPDHAPWLEPWLLQHKAFPYAPHDDFVETTNVVAWWCFRSAPWQRPEPIVSVRRV